jgi:hypothetical protein
VYGKSCPASVPPEDRAAAHFSCSLPAVSSDAPLVLRSAFSHRSSVSSFFTPRTATLSFFSYYVSLIAAAVMSARPATTTGAPAAKPKEGPASPPSTAHSHGHARPNTAAAAAGGKQKSGGGPSHRTVQLVSPLPMPFAIVGFIMWLTTMLAAWKGNYLPEDAFPEYQRAVLDFFDRTMIKALFGDSRVSVMFWVAVALWTMHALEALMALALLLRTRAPVSFFATSIYVLGVFVGGFTLLQPLKAELRRAEGRTPRPEDKFYLRGERIRKPGE